MVKEQQIDDYFCHAPTGINVAEIRHQWLALSPPYDVNNWLLPLPVWGHRNYDHSGAEAWEQLRHDLASSNLERPFCIYLHAPFCSSKCHFCDCYSFKLGSHQEKHIQRYVDHLCYEMRLWSQQGNLSQRPVSTVHMGGGTPTFLGETAIRQIVDCCRSCFAISDNTEWALESTVESLTPTMVATMHQLGYRRLHIGVQSLQEPVRTAINRRRSAAEVLTKIQETLALGWVVSVDLVCGLPGQTLAGFVADIQQLIAAGVNGISLYELLIYPQNRKWAEAQGLTRRSHRPNYFMFQAGASVLEAQGYQKNLFNHWADKLDKNIYFTFPLRAEDCLALGTIADGLFGDYHYRHPRYAAYLRGAQAGQPGLQGGLRRTPQESALLPLTTAVLSSHISPEFAATLEQTAVNGRSLLEQWQQLALIEANTQGGFLLTTNGSWFAGNMVRELARSR
jgi:coproporphyrinogen III oxidase-like Fe-S oxidoreductase